MVFMSRLAKVTSLYMMIDLASDSISWNMFVQQSGPVEERIDWVSWVRGSFVFSEPFSQNVL